MKIIFKPILLLIVAIILLTACEKEGEEVLQYSYHDVAASWYYYGGDEKDIFMVSLLQQQNNVTIDSVSMGDTLTASNSIREFLLTFSYPEKNTTTRVVLTNITDEEAHITELDSVVNLRENRNLSFLKMSANDAVTLYSGSNNSGVENPSVYSAAKYQFYYNEPDLPDSVRLVFYNLYDRGKPYSIDSLNQPALYSLVVHKGQFSNYIELDRGDDIHNKMVYFFQLKDAKTSEIIQDIKLLNKNLNLNTASGYSASITGNPLLLKKGNIYITSDKFITAILYKSGSKYKDKTLFSTEWVNNVDY